MLRRSLILKLFDAFSIQRWNDQIRPVELVEMDKHAHKMAIAWCLARWEEDAGHPVDWHNLIRGGLFELLRRTVLSDIKQPVYQAIRSGHREAFARLSDWVYRQLEPLVDDVGVRADLRRYLVDDDLLDDTSRRILAAAHFQASLWEFRIIQRMNPGSRLTTRVDRLMNSELGTHLDLVGMRNLATGALVSDQGGVSDFVDLVGHLRFQVRWAQTPRIPPTSVLGHSMLVACLSYLLAREVGATDRRLRNDFFGGLFHDLPESVTRDIVSPVKRSIPELAEVIGQIEQELAAAEIYPLVEPSWRDELRYFTTDEFDSKIREAGAVRKVTSDAINASFNADVHDPIDGELIRVADHLSAYAEAYKSTSSGIRTPQLEEGLQLAAAWKGRTVGGIDVGAIYGDFQ
jgi:putative hydrolase of HD superfamily